MPDAGGYRPPTPEEDMQGVLAALVMVLLLVVLPLCMSVWGAVRLFRWAGSGTHAAAPGRRWAVRALALVMVVVVWGTVGVVVRSVTVAVAPPEAPVPAAGSGAND